MVIPDANLLIYSQNPGAVQHRAAAAWLESQFREADTIGLSWLTLWAFVRIVSNPRLWPNPVATEDIFNRIDEWRTQPNVLLVQPGPRHQNILRGLMKGSQSVGTLTTDAALAAIAIEHAATLASTDRDFRRFSGLRWINPLE